MSKRGNNFREEEVEMLLSLVQDKKYIVDCKKTDKITWLNKNQVWNEITDIFNANTSYILRPVDQLRNKYDNIKKRARKKYVEERCCANDTDDSPEFVHSIISIDENVKQIICTEEKDIKPSFDNDTNDKIKNEPTEGLSSQLPEIQNVLEQVFIECSKIVTDNTDDKTQQSDPLETIETKADTCEQSNNVDMPSSNDNRNYNCDMCSKKYTKPYHLKVHKRKHTGEMPYECDVCGKKFISNKYLINHLKIHTDEKAYECNVCKRKFKEASNLARHKQLHTKEKSYECDVCNKKFYRAGDMMNHKRMHTGETPYECEVCNKRFSWQASLAIHKLTHSGDRPYQCDICSKKFKISYNLTRHKLTHTGKRH